MRLQRFLSYFAPQKIAAFTSPYNADIAVWEMIGRRSLLVNGSHQSGPYIDRLWRKAMGAFSFRLPGKQPRVLLLGIGGGSMIRLLAGKFPGVSLVAVDLDPTIIEIAATYFDVRPSEHLRIVTGDAFSFVRQEVSSHRRYDAVIVDLFIGPEVATGVAGEPFLRDVQRLLPAGGSCLINFLREHAYGPQSEMLRTTLTHLFGNVQDYSEYANRFFCVRNTQSGSSPG